MPSVSDFMKELKGANARLDKIEDGLEALKTAVTSVKASTDAVRTAVQQVNTSINTGFGQLVTLGAFTNEALAHHAKQNDTIICILEHISKNTCDLVNCADRQTRVQQNIERSAELLADLYATTHAEAALDRTRRDELRTKIDLCCPPPQRVLPCSYEACPAPEPLRQPPPPPGTAPRPVG
jgi:hypothetical protein